MAKSGTLHHATIRFDGHERASVNVQFENAGIGEPGGMDLDIQVKKGSALEKRVRELGKLLASEVAKQAPSLSVEMHSGEQQNVQVAASDAEAAGTTARRKRQKKATT